MCVCVCAAIDSVFLKHLVFLKHFGSCKRCYEMKIEESEKAGSYWGSNPEHLA